MKTDKNGRFSTEADRDDDDSDDLHLHADIRIRRKGKRLVAVFMASGGVLWLIYEVVRILASWF